jgi:two-component system response regulator CpxR
MPIISIFSGGFCQEGPVTEEVIALTGYRHITDDEIVAEASRRSTLAETKIKRAFSSKTSVFNKFTLEKERSLAFLKLVVADLIATDNALITNFSGQLIPKTVSHTLRVCLIAPQNTELPLPPSNRACRKKMPPNLFKARRRLFLLDRFSV